MPSHTFSALTRFRWHRRSFQVKRHLNNRHLVIEDIFTGFVKTVPLEQLEAALFQGDLCFEVIGRAARPHPQPDVITEYTYLSLEDCDPQQVTIAQRRFEIIHPLLALSSRERSQAYLDTYLAHIQKTYPAQLLHEIGCQRLSRATLYRWMRAYKESNGDLRSLIPNTHHCGGKGQSRLDTTVETLMVACLEENLKRRPRQTLTALYAELCLQIQEYNANHPAQKPLAPPAKSTLTRRYRALWLNQEQTRPAQRPIKAMNMPEQPLDRVEIDHTLTDLMVVDDDDHLPLGRLVLTLCIDVRTRYPLGYYLGFDQCSYHAVSACLYHAIHVKPDTCQVYSTQHQWQAYGIPKALVTDNGKEFRGSALREACQLLGTSLIHTPIRTHQRKPYVERMFNTLNTGFFHSAPGTTLSGGNYEKTACVYLSQIDKAVHIFIVDIYAESYHTGLQGIPAREWENAIEAGLTPRLPSSAEELRILLAQTTSRVLRRQGITFFYLRYNSPELTPLRLKLNGRPAKIKYHPGDLSYLHVYDPFEMRYIRVPALDQKYTQGLSLWKHKFITQEARRRAGEVDQYALAQARRKIQTLFETGAERRHRARWRGLSRNQSASTDQHTIIPPPEMLSDDDLKDQFHLNEQHTLNWQATLQNTHHRQVSDHD